MIWICTDDRRSTVNHWIFDPATTMRLATYVTALPADGNVGNWVKLPAGAVPLTSAKWPQVRFTGYTPRRSVQGMRGMTAVTEEETPAEAAPAPLDWSPKTHRYVLEAVAQQILTLRRGLDREGLTDDEQSGLANDLALYEGIRQSLELRSPLPAEP